MKNITSHPDISTKTIRNFSIPSIGLGTYQMQGSTCQEAVRDAILMGYRHIDTAQMYDNEIAVGTGIAASGIPREALFVTNKIWLDNLEPEKLKSTFQQSLEKLQMNYIDLLLIHWPPANEETITNALKTMRELRSKEYIRKIGVSNFTPRLLVKALAIDEIIANQVEYHPMLAQNDLIDICETYNVFLIAYAPLGQGQILGTELLQQIGKKYGKSESQVILRWLIQQRLVATIPKASNHEHRKSNIDIFDFELSESEMHEIAALDRGARQVNPQFAPRWDEKFELKH